VIDQRLRHRGQYGFGSGHGSRDEQQALLHMDKLRAEWRRFQCSDQTIAHTGTLLDHLVGTHE
jgi:hypothetical protein